MANKAVLGVLGVIIFASFGVGILVGMQLGGGVDAPTNGVQTTDDPTDTPSNDGEASDGDASDGESSASEGTEAATATPLEQRTTVPPRRFDEAEIAEYVVQFVNDGRQDRGLEALSTSESTAEEVRAMAQEHSVAMADEGEMAHEIDGAGTAGRYKDAGLYDRCKFNYVEKTGVRQPDTDFEALALTKAGQPYDADGETQFDGDERAVARTIVDNWMESSEDNEGVLIVGASLVGVGVEVTDAGNVFVTANVCG